MDVFDLLKTLTTTPGPSGMETDIATVIAEIWRPYVDDLQFDPLGNVIATKYGIGDFVGDRRPRLLISAHMDEIALMVADVIEHNGYGFLRVVNVGGIDRRQVLGQRVVVHGKRNVPAVIGCLPFSMLAKEKQGKARDYEDIVVDTGISAEATKSLIRIGDFVTFHQPLHKLLNNIVAGKAIDNRASVAALTVALETLQGRQHSWDIIIAATIQEETRLLGGYTSAFGQKPDIAVAFDTAFATQHGVSNNAHALGSGPLLDIGVNVHPAILQGIRDAAARLEMKVNHITHTRSSGTETAAIQLTQAGIPTGLISLPIRYMHNVVEAVSTKDVKRVGRLISEFALGLDDKFLPALTDALLRPVKED